MELAHLESKIKEGNGNFENVYNYARMQGRAAAKGIMNQLQSEFPDGGIAEADARRIVSGILRKTCKAVAEMTAIVIKDMYEREGFGLKAIEPEYNKDREDEIVETIMKEYDKNEPD